MLATNCNGGCESTTTGYYDIANLLLFYGADPNARANREETPLHFAAMHGNTAVVDLLLRHRARVGAADEDGRTPIWVAAFYGNAGALAALLANRERQQGGGRQQQANEGKWTDSLCSRLVLTGCVRFFASSPPPFFSFPSEFTLSEGRGESTLCGGAGGPPGGRQVARGGRGKLGRGHK